MDDEDGAGKRSLLGNITLITILDDGCGGIYERINQWYNNSSMCNYLGRGALGSSNLVAVQKNKRNLLFTLLSKMFSRDVK